MGSYRCDRATRALDVALLLLPILLIAFPTARAKADGNIFKPKVDYETQSYASQSTVQDINGDGKLDIVTCHDGGDSITVYYGVGDGTFVPGPSSWVPVGPPRFVLGRFNSDPWYDVALPCVGCGYVAIELGDSTGHFTLTSFQPTAGGTAVGAITSGLLNSDANLDLVVWDGSSPGNVQVLLGNGDGTFQPYASYPTGLPVQDVAVVDYNGDDIPDLAVAATSCCPDLGEIAILPGLGGGAFGPGVDLPSCQSPDAISVGDANGDNYPDLMVDCADQFIHVFTGSGNGTFSTHPVIPRPFGKPSIALADFDGDGKMDIAQALFSGFDSAYVYLGNGDGTFQSPRTYQIGQNPSSIAAADLNADSKIDLVATNYIQAFSPSSISVLINCEPCIPSAIAVALDQARVEAGVVHLRWVVPQTSGSVFFVYRRVPEGEWQVIGTAEPEGLGAVTYQDASVVPGGRYAYKLLAQSIGDQGFSAEVWVTVPSANTPAALRLDPLYPNPFQTQTALNFGLPGAAPVTLAIYSVTGRRVATILDGQLPAGWRSAAWDGRDSNGRLVASGTYFAKLESTGKVEIRKVVVAR